MTHNTPLGCGGCLACDTVLARKDRGSRMATPTRPCPYCGAAVLMNAPACGTCGRPMPPMQAGAPGAQPAKTMFGYAAPVVPGQRPGAPQQPGQPARPGQPAQGGYPQAQAPAPGAQQQGFPPPQAAPQQ